MKYLYTLSDLLKATGGRLAGPGLDGAEPRDPGVRAISIDSRDVPAGALFAAIKGGRLDGHDFVGAALKNGAVLAMIGQDRADEFAQLPVLIVPDVLKGLEDLARFARDRSHAQFVGVTGSVGKTTTKELIRSALAAAGQTHASIKSFNNHWGVPLMLARMPVEARFGVFEIGMNHPGEITPLTKLVRPDLAIITTVAPAHLEAFDSVADIARAKGEILGGLRPGGTLILGGDHAHVQLLRDMARDAGVENIVSYGFSSGADVVIENYAADAQTSSAQIEIAGARFTLTLGAPGRHVMANAVGAVLVADALGVPIERALAGIGAFSMPEGRGVLMRLGPKGQPGISLIDESYNANPASMQAALDVFATMKAEGGRRVLVLGEMLELGALGPQLHADLADAVLAARPDRVILVGAMMSHLEKTLAGRLETELAKNAESLSERVAAALAPGDLVMVKGSNGLRLGRLVAAIKQRFGAPQ